MLIRSALQSWLDETPNHDLPRWRAIADRLDRLENDRLAKTEERLSDLQALVVKRLKGTG